MTRATRPQDSPSDRVTEQTKTTQRLSITDATARSRHVDGHLASTTASTYDNVGSTAATVISTKKRVNVLTTPPSSSVISIDFKPQVMSGEPV